MVAAVKRLAAGCALLLAALPRRLAALDGRGVITEYAWASSADCTGPVSQVLATYRLDECTPSVYASDGYLRFSWAPVAPGQGFPSELRLGHYGTDSRCRALLRNSSEGLLGCTSRPNGPASGKPASKMMVFGPAQIVMETYENTLCTGDPRYTERFLSYSCWNTAQGSEMVGKDAHVRYSQHECQGLSTESKVVLGECIAQAATGTAVRYTLAPPSFWDEPLTGRYPNDRAL